MSCGKEEGERNGKYYINKRSIREIYIGMSRESKDVYRTHAW